jgi:acyl-CoA thioester hydrolase
MQGTQINMRVLVRGRKSILSETSLHSHEEETTMSSSDSAPIDLTLIDGHKKFEKVTLRYADTDRQGHVNNAVFATFLESGRVSILYAPDNPIAPEGASFVLARLVLDFRAEIHWPGEVLIGTSILRLGNSSVTLGQGVFFNGRCAATAETVIVLVDETTRKARPLPESSRKALECYGRSA